MNDPNQDLGGVETGGGQAPPEPDREAGGSGGEELESSLEPVTTGTLFIMIVFLMALAGMWGIMFLHLLDR